MRVAAVNVCYPHCVYKFYLRQKNALFIQKGGVDLW